MTGFGDDDPEDAWHPDDPPAELVANLERRAVLLDAAAYQPDPTADPLQRVAVLTALVARWQRMRWSARNLVRLDLLAEDLEHVRRRL